MEREESGKGEKETGKEGKVRGKVRKERRKGGRESEEGIEERREGKDSGREGGRERGREGSRGGEGGGEQQVTEKHERVKLKEIVKKKKSKKDGSCERKETDSEATREERGVIGTRDTFPGPCYDVGVRRRQGGGQADSGGDRQDQSRI